MNKASSVLNADSHTTESAPRRLPRPDSSKSRELHSTCIRSTPDAGDQVLDGNKTVAVMRVGTWSPTLQAGIDDSISRCSCEFQTVGRLLFRFKYEPDIQGRRDHVYLQRQLSLRAGAV